MTKEIKFNHRKYPLFGYRISPEAKKSLEVKLVKLVDEMNDTLSPISPKYSKAEVFSLALSLGMDIMTKTRGGAE